MNKIAGRIFPVCIVFITAMTLSSCDFFRKLAGRPTSATLATLQWRKDSLEKIQLPAAIQADTLVVNVDSVEIARLGELALGCIVHPLSRYQGLSDGNAVALFHVIGGTFKNGDNARRYCAKLQDTTFPQAKLLTLKTGLYIVSLLSSDSAEGLAQTLKENTKQLPPDAWIMVNDLR